MPCFRHEMPRDFHVQVAGRRMLDEIRITP